MRNNKIIKLLIVGIIISLLLAVLGASYAYFSLLIEGESKNMVTEMGSLRLKYDDTDVITLNNIIPGDSVTKTITVKNIGSMDVPYNIVWEDLYNEFINKELTIEMKCTRLNENGNEEGTCEDLVSTPISNVKIKTNINIEPNITHKYEVKITFIDTGASQNYNKNAKFQGKINFTKYSSNEPIYCNFDGDLVQGAEYVNGQYTYRYKQELDLFVIPQSSSYNGNVSATFMSSNYKLKKLSSENLEISWQDIDVDGWGVALTDIDSTDPVDTSLCTYINGKPVVSMRYMFAYSDVPSVNFENFNTSNVINMSNMFNNSLITQIDLNGFDTSNVTNMNDMFYYSKATTLDLSSFNTSKVTNMSGIFRGSQATTLDLSNFDTSNVTNMAQMFAHSKAAQIDVSSFDTSNVTDMSSMFSSSQATTLDLSNFDTSNVTDMNSMFADSDVTTLVVSNFDTSNVIDMSYMFYYTDIATLELSNFVTSKVTDMNNMFCGCQATTLDLSSFDTSKVTNMYGMFNSNQAITLDLSNFDTSNVTNMEYMFRSSNANKIDVSSFNTSNVTNMYSMFEGSKAAVINLGSFDTSKVTNMNSMFAYCYSLTTIYASNNFDTSSFSGGNSDIFIDSSKLVGGAGTKYSSSNTGKTYARIDGGTSSPGYFTLKN